MAPRAFITGLAGTTITPDERSFLRAAAPWGLILFKRNIADPAQVHALTNEFRSICGRDDVPVLVDQEGGRVQRLGPPHWPAYPAGAAFGRLYGRDPPSACGRHASAPVSSPPTCRRSASPSIACRSADVPVAGADRVIGDRAYGDTPEQVSAIAAAVAAGLAERRRPSGRQALARPRPRHRRQPQAICRSSPPTAAPWK